jgi:hypothetical protein
VYGPNLDVADNSGAANSDAANSGALVGTGNPGALLRFLESQPQPSKKPYNYIYRN